MISLLEPVLPTLATLAAALAVSLALAAAIHYGVEKPISGRARRWLERVLSRGYGNPPTGPGGSVPSLIPAQKAGEASGSSRTVEPTFPGR